ncbi:MAG: hypothetical protein CVU55_00695 [Deltaproteobacteria bacterium HGW-Deltaproteobacteria-13]|jgi:hypothetical protein|nr:MAG: hypothetical protein CVU55_00695 [Deltaproteobacteria bacterium HGW-Deltaproteobacteria-13]
MNKRVTSLVIAVMLVPFLFACAHLEKPSETMGKNNDYIDWGKNPPTPRDMAKHTIKGENPFEWWYFDGHLDTGETFVGVFLAPSFTTGKPGVTFSLYGSDWKKESHQLTLADDDMKVSTEDINLICPAGYISRLDNDNYLVGWDLEGIKADFKLTTLAPGWLPIGGSDVYDDKKEFFWAVHQGQNRIEGTIVQNGITRKVTGVGYADHNWGKKSLNKIATSWVWGRIITGGYTIIYADVQYRDPNINSRPLYIARGNQIIVGSGSPAIRQFDYVTHPELKRHYPRQISIDHAAKGVEAHIQIRFRTLVEDVDMLTVSNLNPFAQWVARTFVTRPTYFRIIADYDGTIVDNGVSVPVKGECLYEVMGLE